MIGRGVSDQGHVQNAVPGSHPRIGFLTIGQAPRPDMVAPLAAFPDIDLVEVGALDGVAVERGGLLQPSATEATYVSKLRTGRAVRIGRKALLPLLETKLDELGNGVDAIVMACTGSFPELTSSTPVIYPDQLVSGVVRGLTFVSHLGLLAPLPEQVGYLKEKWDAFPGRVSVQASSPYDGSNPMEAAAKLKDQGADLIVLDCMGYSSWHRSQARAATGLPAILPQSLVAANVRELFAGRGPEGGQAHG